MSGDSARPNTRIEPTRRGVLPDLRYSTAEVHAQFDAIVRGGALASAGMASFADVVSETDAAAIHVFLIREQTLLRAEEQSP